MQLNVLVPSLIFMMTLNGMAQNTENNTAVNNHYFSLTFGLNTIDNSNNTFLPFDGGKFNFKTPFFLTAEQRIHKNWSLALTVSTNKLELGNPAETAPYFSTDLFANLFLDDLVITNENIDLYVGLGTGIHTLQGKAAGSFNFNAGFRQWVSERVAINLQAIGKINRDGLVPIGNHYQFNVGVSYKFKQIDETIEEVKEVTLPVKQDANLTESTKDIVDEVSPVSQEPTEEVLDADKTERKEITVTSTDLANNAYERDMIKKNAKNILNKKTLDTREDGVKIGYHVIIYAFQNKNNLNNVLRDLSKKGIEVQVIYVPVRNLNYISIGCFNTKEEAESYIETTLDKDTFVGSWVYEVN